MFSSYCERDVLIYSVSKQLKHCCYSNAKHNENFTMKIRTRFINEKKYILNPQQAKTVLIYENYSPKILKKKIKITIKSENQAEKF